MFLLLKTLILGGQTAFPEPLGGHGGPASLPLDPPMHLTQTDRSSLLEEGSIAHLFDTARRSPVRAAKHH